MSLNNTILMVDDDPHDIFLTERAFSRLQWGGDFNSVCGADELFQYLGVTADSGLGSRPLPEALPDVVLLDLNMPQINGFEVLQKLRENKYLAHLPVVVLSTSQAPDDVRKAYTLGANSFISKPSTPKAMTELATLFKNYWFDLSKLPDNSIPAC